MSSDSNQTPQSGKRKKLVKLDSEDSDESIVQSRRRKKTFVCKIYILLFKCIRFEFNKIFLFMLYF